MLDKQQITGAKTEHAPDDYLLNWTQKRLPDAKSFWVSDADLIIRDRKNNLMIVEVKRYKAVMSHSQRTTYFLIDALIKKALKNGDRVKLLDDRVMACSYAGFFVLQFEKTSFEDGCAYINGKKFTEFQVMELLSFRKTFKQILADIDVQNRCMV